MHVSAERRDAGLVLTCLGCYAQRQVPDDDPLISAYLDFELVHDPCDRRSTVSDAV